MQPIHSLIPSSPGSVNHTINEKRGRKSVKVFKGREEVGEEEEIEMLNSSVEGNRSISHATNHLSNHQKEDYDKIISQPTESLNFGRQYDLATARFSDGTKSVRATVISHLFQSISF